MNSPSATHLLLIPTFNTGAIVMDVVKEALNEWQPVWVVVDGSDDGTGKVLEELAKSEPGLTVLHHPRNQGKGRAIYTGIKAAAKKGFSHVLTMDADGQHSAAAIKHFMEASMAQPDALILGEPVFDDNAPALRVKGRQISNFWANLETLWAGIHDSLFGFRVYPLKPLVNVMEQTAFARRFDFDPEVVVRLVWQGLPAVNIPVSVRYLSAAEGGVSQFKYLRDNVLLTWMHLRLFFGFLIRLPVMVWRRIAISRE